MDEITKVPGLSSEERLTYKDSTYEIVSKVSYLIGVPKRYFESDSPSPKMEVFTKLETDMPEEKPLVGNTVATASSPPA